MTIDRGRFHHTVLIIEDMPNVSRLIRVALQGRPVTVEMIKDGKRGLERAKEIIPVLILLDLALPTLHGFDVLRELRASPATADIPVVIVTAQGDSQTALEARRLGADQFISKPFLLTELRRSVGAFLDQALGAEAGSSARHLEAASWHGTAGDHVPDAGVRQRLET